MSERLSARAAAGFATLLLIALLMAANHVSARLAFQHGVDVPTAVTVRSLKVSAGAGFIVALTGEIMTMPGLPKVPAAEKIDVDENGRITGLF